MQKQKGITLIALIITIIVMLILIGVTISIAINEGLFLIAKQATDGTKNEIRAEETLSDGRVKIDGIWYDSMENYVEGKESTNQIDNMPSYSDAKKEGDYLVENATFTDETGIAVIPKGFKVVDGKDGEQSIDAGLVIQDVNGNEFVWIPVTYTATGKLDEHKLDSGFLEVFYRSNWKNNARENIYDNNSQLTEPFSKGTGYTEEANDYYDMMLSVQKNRGFYIGRYEAGSTNPRIDEANGTTNMVVKRDQYPYNCVGWGNAMNDIESDVEAYEYETNEGKGAVYLSKHMYDSKDVGVTSTLCYGVQWDAMLDFIKDDDHNVTNSTTWGNYADSFWTISRTQAKYSEDLGKTWKNVTENKLTKVNNVLLTTGASDDFAAKNIYDVAGNCFEWTMEALFMNTRVRRGGYFNDDGSSNSRPASSRSNDYPNFAGANVSFRPALYIKN